MKIGQVFQSLFVFVNRDPVVTLNRSASLLFPPPSLSHPKIGRKGKEEEEGELARGGGGGQSTHTWAS